MTEAAAGDPAGQAAWVPILEGSLAGRAGEALAAICAQLPRRFPVPGLAGGEAGAALLFSYLDQAQPGRGWGARSRSHLDQAAGALAGEVLGPTFYSGFSGIAWAADHIQRQAPAPAPEEDPNEEIDAALEGFLDADPWRGNYDLISGLVGYGLYGLDRMDRPAGARLASRVIEHLDRMKIPTADGHAWHTGPHLLPPWQRERNPQGYFNLGLAHGIPGVLAFLGQAWRAGLSPDRTLDLIQGAVHWLLSQRNPGQGPCSYANVIPTGLPRETVPTRIAWCYGDLGLATALFWTALVLDRADWQAEALAMALGAAERPIEDAGAKDAGLCHGAAGNAHLFNRLWQATGEPRFHDAALRWFETTLAYREPGQGLGGFRAWIPDPDSGSTRSPWVDAPGLLEGSVGIALALLSAIAPHPPDWDRMLLVSVPPRPDLRVGDKK